MGTIIFFVTLLMFAGGKPVAGQVATDSFTYSNGNLPTVSSSKWALSGTTTQALTVSSNQLSESGTLANTAAIWAGTGTFGDDQYSQITVASSSGSTRYIGVAIRGTTGTSAANKNFYYFACSSVNCKAGKYVAGSATPFVSAAHGLSLPFTIKAQVVGSTLTFTVNGSTPSGFSATYTDTSLTTGKPGVFEDASASNTALADDWSGGNYSATPDTPTITPTAGTYPFMVPNVTISTCTGGTNYYTTDGSTPTSGSTSYSAPFNITASGSTTVKAICIASGNSSAVASNAYSVDTTVTELATDNFTSYARAEFDYPQSVTGSFVDGELQYPLDQYFTTTWRAVGGISGTSRNLEYVGYVAPVGTQVCTGTGGSRCVRGAGSGISASANISVTYSPDQYSKAGYKTTNSTGNYSGVIVRGSTDGSTASGYMLLVAGNTSGSGSVILDKMVAGSATHLCASAGLTFAVTGTVELRISGSTLYPLLNGSAIPGCSATYTDTTITQGNPGVALSNEANYVFDWSGGNVGSSPASGNSTPVINWTYGTYSNSFATGNDAYPWVNFWPGRGYTPGALTLGSVTGWGPNGPTAPAGKGTAITQYQAPFGASGQYQKWTVAVDTFNDYMSNWFMPLMTERWVPGFSGPSGSALGSDSPCHIAGTDSVCNDEVAIYPGVQPHNDLILRSSGTTYDDKVNVHCTGTVGKIEYTCSPAMHITRVKPDPTYPNTVETLATSDITPLKGDEWYDEYRDGHVRVACKGVGFSTAWQANHSYSFNDLILDPNGNLQRVIQAGTSGSTIPSTWGSTWGVMVSTTYILKGASTTDNTVKWEYYLKPCPTSATWSWVIPDAYDANFAGRMGFPGLWMGGAVPDGATITPTPFIKDWQAGTATSSTSMTLLGIAPPNTYQPALVIFW